MSREKNAAQDVTSGQSRAVCAPVPCALRHIWLSALEYGAGPACVGVKNGFHLGFELKQITPLVV